MSTSNMIWLCDKSGQISLDGAPLETVLDGLAVSLRGDSWRIDYLRSKKLILGVRDRYVLRVSSDDGQSLIWQVRVEDNDEQTRVGDCLANTAVAAAALPALFVPGFAGIGLSIGTSALAGFMASPRTPKKTVAETEYEGQKIGCELETMIRNIVREELCCMRRDERKGPNSEGRALIRSNRSPKMSEKTCSRTKCTSNERGLDGIEPTVRRETNSSTSSTGTGDCEVFISYKREEYEHIKPVCELLDELQIRYWIDRDGNYSGQNFKREITKAIRHANLVLFFSSKQSNASVHVKKEIALAVRADRIIVPIKLDDAEYADEIEYDLVDIDYISISEIDRIRERLLMLRAGK